MGEMSSCCFVAVLSSCSKESFSIFCVLRARVSLVKDPLDRCDH